MPGPVLAGAVPCPLWQGGMLEGAEAVVVPELLSASSHWELCRQRGHASAGKGDRLSRPPQPRSAARGAEKPEEDAGEVSLSSAACASASHSGRSWR